MSKTALITGVGRANGIAYTLAKSLAQQGWNLALNYWHAYDDRAALSRTNHDLNDLAAYCQQLGVKVLFLEKDLENPQTPQLLMEKAQQLGEVRAVVASHAESVDSSIRDTSVKSFDRHFAVNTRANWLLLKAYAQYAQDQGLTGTKSFIAMTSDHVAHNLPYGMSKGALDRLIAAGAVELGADGFRVNAINPGPIDTGWMDDSLRDALQTATPAGRLGTPADAANLVSFLLSENGQWINGQILHSNGGFGVS